MIINSIRVTNYKSITDSGYIEIHNKLTVFAGKNNVGKTAFIEAIQKFFEGSYNTPNKVGGGGSSGITQREKATLNIVVSLDDSDMFSIYEGLTEELWYGSIELCLEAFEGRTFLTEIKCHPTSAKPFSLFKWNYLNDRNIHEVAVFDKLTGNIEYATDASYDFIDKLYFLIKNSIVFLSSNRTSIMPNQPIVANEKLDTYGSNLHNVFHTLHNNKEEFFEYIQGYFIKIFPDVKQIRTTVDGNTTNINLVFKNFEKAIPLNECGSGMVQVLIILCLIISDKKRLILFDEPHSFLHQSAEKAIYDLTLHSSHQFIFTTHSPILINYPSLKNLYLVTNSNGYSEYALLNEIHRIFAEIGLTNGDFALCEKIIIVEGKTEETVLPIILNRYYMGKVGYSYHIINLEGTGNQFIKKSAMNRNASIHSKIFNSISLAPIPYVFLVDRDERSEERINIIRDAYQEKVLILKRREIENYFLEPNAIASLLKINNIKASAKDIELKIKSLLDMVDDKTLYLNGCNVPIEDVKGSMVLELIFHDYNLIYDKVAHGKYLASYIDIDCLKEIADLIRNFLVN
ncbi:MAG: hypothetical protein JL50_04505 [Peptococcaceae bacterium BICA1-7]|nr:MAG: hypothetical protein JL50_04505 [Peptococcaceae bacterium BICA1-7]HBV95885.1 hypothetical protein [Desulfotomaculum sp.]